MSIIYRSTILLDLVRHFPGHSVTLNAKKVIMKEPNQRSLADNKTAEANYNYTKAVVDYHTALTQNITTGLHDFFSVQLSIIHVTSLFGHLELLCLT